MSRFDYVKYDEECAAFQSQFKSRVEQLENLLEGAIVDEFAGPQTVEYKKHALKSLEEFYCWIGKVIREVQVHKNDRAEGQEERTNS